jgi:Flp pilus assembly protein TadG
MRIAMRQHRSKGQALVEFALMATLIFFLLAATVDLGLIFFTIQGLHNAAQEGATFGSRWLKNNSSGPATLDYRTIRDHVRNEAGNRGSGFANLLDLNNNGIDDFTEDSGNMDKATGTTVFPDYIQIRGLLDADRDGDPTNDGSAPDYTPCPNVADRTLRCYLKVDVYAMYKPLFPFAPTLFGQRKLRSSYVILMRSGMSQGGSPNNPPVISTVTPSPRP